MAYLQGVNIRFYWLLLFFLIWLALAGFLFVLCFFTHTSTTTAGLTQRNHPLFLKIFFLQVRLYKNDRPSTWVEGQGFSVKKFMKNYSRQSHDTAFLGLFSFFSRKILKLENSSFSDCNSLIRLSISLILRESSSATWRFADLHSPSSFQERTDLISSRVRPNSFALMINFNFSTSCVE